MAKKINESKIVPGFSGPFYPVDEGKVGGFCGVWFKRDDGKWSHICSGLAPENAKAIAGALNKRGLFGGLNEFAKSVKIV